MSSLYGGVSLDATFYPSSFTGTVTAGVNIGFVGVGGASRPVRFPSRGGVDGV